MTPPPETMTDAIVVDPPQDILEKYTALKERFFQLEEKYKECSNELQRSSERNVKIREERNMLLERILELEAQQPHIMTNGMSVAQPESSALPRSLLNSRARTEFIENLRQAEAEGENEPVVSSSSLARGTKRTRGKTKARVTRSVDEDGEGSASSPPMEDDEYDGDYAPPRKLTKRDQDLDADPSDSTPVRRSARPKRASAIRGELSETEPSPSSRKGQQKKSRPADEPTTDSLKSEPTSSSVIPVAQSAKSDTMSPVVSTASTPAPAVSLITSRASSTPGPSTPSSTSSVTSTGINPYMSYYSPSTPITPSAPTYPFNPYYYLPAGIPGMYPAPYPAPLSQPQPRPQLSPTLSDVQRQAKPKRLKAHTVTSKSFNIPTVPRDKNGKPMLPLNVGIMTVISLGAVCMREHFHTERYIFPVGYEVSRRYLSTIDPTHEVVYHCTILDGGDGPKFQIVPSDTPDRPVIAGTATGAWSSIVKQANTIRNRQHSNSVSGPDFFGLGQNTIKHLIQQLPNADKLRDYVWQHFIEGGPLGGRHAAVVPALPEDYNSSVPIGAYYPSERDKVKRALNVPPPQSTKSHYPPHVVAQTKQPTPPSHPTQQQLPAAPPSQLSGPSSIHINPIPTPPSASEIFDMQEYHNDHKSPPEREQSPPFPSLLSNGFDHSPILSHSSSVPATFASIMNAYPAEPTPSGT